MNADELRSLQAPLKARYRDDPGTAVVTLRAAGRVGADAPTCEVAAWRSPVMAGLHPAAGGDGTLACSGDMLLQALVGCAGVTLKAVATALDIPLRGATVSADGNLDFRGTLGVAKDAPVGFARIRLHFALDTDATADKLDKLVALTERYCVVYQTLRAGPTITVSHGMTTG